MPMITVPTYTVLVHHTYESDATNARAVRRLICIQFHLILWT